MELSICCQCRKEFPPKQLFSEGYGRFACAPCGETMEATRKRPAGTFTADITEAMERVDRAAGKILDRYWPKAPAKIDQDAINKEHDELLRASLSLLNKMRRTNYDL